jgi:hypothetical protein
MPRVTQKLSHKSLFIVSALILLFLLQCAWFIGTQSLTNDEPEHIVAGWDMWHNRQFENLDLNGHPPLARLLFALPLVGENVTYTRTNGGIHPLTPAPSVWLRARSMNVLLGVFLLILLWNTARHLFSNAAANFVLALAVLSPDLVAHYSLATTDGASTLFIFASVVQLMRWRRNPTRGQTILLGVLLGGMLVSKFNTPPLVAIILAMVLVLTPTGIQWRPKGWHFRQAALALLLACVVVWSGYFFHVAKVTFANQMVTIHFAGSNPTLQQEMPTFKTPVNIYIPACEWMVGLGWQLDHNTEGHRTFLLGKYSTTGFKSYFPVAMFTKWPLAMLFLSMAGVFTMLWRKFETRRELLWMSIFPAVYIALAILARIDIGVRHMLPIYPFLLLFTGCVWEAARRVKWATALLGILLIAQVADIARYAPNYLAYFNPLVRPENTWQILSDSNTDWGEGMLALRKYQAEHPGQVLHLAYFGEVDPLWYGVQYQKLNEEDHPSGTVIVSATHLSGQLLNNHYAYRWLLQYPLKAVLDHTFYVFEVPTKQ